MNPAQERVAAIQESLKKTAHPQISFEHGMATGLYKEAWERIKKEIPEPYYCGVCGKFQKDPHTATINYDTLVVTCDVTGTIKKPKGTE